MSRFNIHTADTAPKAATPILNGNYTNHIAENPVDATFAANAWSRPETAAV